MSLQGFGRSSGNANLETIVFLLKRYGLNLKINPIELLNISEKYIIPLMPNPGKNITIDLVSGFSQFHSSYMPIIDEFSNKYKLDPKELIMYVSKKEKVSVTNKIVKKVAQNLVKKNKKKKEILGFNFKRYAVNEQGE